MECLYFCRPRNEAEVHKCSVRKDGSMSFLPPLRKDASVFQRFRRAFKKSTLISETNPQNIEYFRSKAEIFRVRKEHVESGSFIIHPFSDFRAYYEMWMMIVWFLTIFYLTADASFDVHGTGNVHSDASIFEIPPSIDTFGVILRAVGLIDMIFTFLTGYPVKRKRRVVMKPLKIAKTYVLSIYFPTDLLASLPLSYFASNLGSQRLIELLALLRLLRIPTLYFYMSRTLDFFDIRNVVTTTLKNIIINYLVFHWFACVQYIIPHLRYYLYGEILAESWAEKFDLPELSAISRYIMCLYRAAGSLFCISFDQLDLIVWEEKVVAIITFIFGKVYLFYITVLILNYLLRQRSLEIKYFETISQVQAYMSQKQLPMSMQTRLLQFYEYKYNKKFFKERAISSLLSDKLRAEINLSVCSKLVQNVSLFAKLPQQQLEHIVINLKPEIYLANDIIIKAGSVGDCMYFLASGTVGVWTPSGKEVCHLQDGAYFGEVSLVFKDKRRTANIIAIETCEVYKLDRKAFKNCFKTNSELYKTLEYVANERMEMTQIFEDVHAKTFMELS